MTGESGVYDDTGTCVVGSTSASQGGYYSGYGALGVSGTTPPVAGTGGFTTNGQWSQQAIVDMQALGTSVDVGTLSAALGAYITGRVVTAAQQSLIDQAIAIEGYPPVAGPNGYPPAMNVQAPVGQTVAVGTCGTGYTYSDSNPGTAGVISASGGTGYCVPVSSGTHRDRRETGHRHRSPRHLRDPNVDFAVMGPHPHRHVLPDTGHVSDESDPDPHGDRHYRHDHRPVPEPYLRPPRRGDQRRRVGVRGVHRAENTQLRRPRVTEVCPEAPRVDHGGYR